MTVVNVRSNNENALRENESVFNNIVNNFNGTHEIDATAGSSQTISGMNSYWFRYKLMNVNIGTKIYAYGSSNEFNVIEIIKIH